MLHGEAAVRAGGDRDRVLPVRGDGYEGRTRGRIRDLLNEARIDAFFGERPYQGLAEPVVADAAEKGHAHAKEGCGGGLVGPLAAVVGRETGIRDRLAGRGTALHDQDEILVYRTNDEDVSHFDFARSFGCWWPTCDSRPVPERSRRPPPAPPP